MRRFWGEPSLDGLGVRRYLLRFRDDATIKVFDRPSSYVDPPQRFMIELLVGRSLADVRFAATKSQAQRVVDQLARELAEAS